MSSEWNLTTLGEFCPFSYGKGLPERNRKTGTIPVISSAGIVGYHNEVLVKVGGIVVGRKGTVGSVTLSKKPFWAIDTAFFIIDEPQKRDLYFTYYLLKTLNLPLMNSDSAVPGLNRENAHALAVNIPSLQLQKRISSILCALDSRISLLHETNATLEAIAQALFKSWFVDFDPVHAKAEGHQPEGIDAETAALFPNSFEGSELGLVPKGWGVGILNDICKITSGKRPCNRSDIPTSSVNIPLYGGAGVMGFTTETLYSDRKILTGRVGTLGQIHIAYPPFWASDNVLVLSPINNRDFFFCFHWLSTINMHALNRGSTQPLLTQKDLGNQKNAISPSDIMEEFSNIVTPIYEKISECNQQNQTLSSLRDTLLPRLISGQLRLPEVSTLMEGTP